MQSDLDKVKAKAAAAGIDWDDQLFNAAFGKGTYRWLIDVMGISYLDGMEIGLFDLNNNYDHNDL